MPTFSPTKIDEAIGAFRVRSTLEEIDLRQQGGSVSSAGHMIGTRSLSGQLSGKKLPVFDQNGKPFASSIIGQSKGLAIPSGVPVGSIIEYKSDDNKKRYAIVGENKDQKKKKGIFVKTMKPKEVKKLRKNNPNLSIFSFSSTDLYKQSSSIFAVIFDAIDPSETILIKFLTKALLGKIFIPERSVIDIFLIIYFRIIVISLLLIGVVTLTTRLVYHWDSFSVHVMYLQTLVFSKIGIRKVRVHKARITHTVLSIVKK